MEEYRSIYFGADGQIMNRVDIRCRDETEAWRLARVIVRAGPRAERSAGNRRA